MSPEIDALIRASVVVDVFKMATADYWLRRAGEFEAAKPRLGDFHGQATREELSAAWQRCHSIAQACRERALLCERGESWEAAATPLAS